MTIDRDMTGSGLEILYHEGPCIVVNKPSGIATQAPGDVAGVEDLVKDYLREREGKSGKIYLGVPHRLDRPVSGAIVFARHVRAARRLSEQFQNRTVRKTYWALVPAESTETAETESQPDSGTWQDHLRKVPGRAAAEVVDATHPDGREAVLHFERKQLVQMPGDQAPARLLEIQLETGRTHQIRVQAASRGLPILGDEQYGSTIDFGPQTDDLRCRAIGLHARSLQFENTKTRERVSIVAPLPEYWPDAAT